MSDKAKINLYWFIRSFIFSFVIFACILAFFMGSVHCYAVMEKDRTGNEVQFFRRDENNFFVFGHEIALK